METITLRNGDVVKGQLIRVYSAFEGGQRYIFKTATKEVRCVKDETGKYVEYVA